MWYCLDHKYSAELSINGTVFFNNGHLSSNSEDCSCISPTCHLLLLVKCADYQQKKCTYMHTWFIAVTILSLQHPAPPSSSVCLWLAGTLAPPAVAFSPLSPAVEKWQETWSNTSAALTFKPEILAPHCADLCFYSITVQRYNEFLNTLHPTKFIWRL